MEQLYACIRASAVVEIKIVSEDQPFVNEGYDRVFDVTNMDPPVTAGWLYIDGQLVAPQDVESSIADDAADFVKMEARFKFGNQLCDHMIKILSIRNRSLGKTSAQVNTMISAFFPIEMALRKCALPTALGGIMQIKTIYAGYDAEFQYAITELQAFLANE